MIKDWALKRFQRVWLLVLFGGVNLISHNVKDYMRKNNPILNNTSHIRCGAFDLGTKRRHFYH